MNPLIPFLAIPLPAPILGANKPPIPLLHYNLAKAPSE